MPKFLLSQGPTAHSRIGNSLLWMRKFQNFANSLDASFVFPWALENFSSFLSEESCWLSPTDELFTFFKGIFSQDLTAASLARASRKLEANFESRNGLNPHSWSYVIESVIPGQLAFLSGKIDLRSQELREIIDSHMFIICHEPFEYLFPELQDTRESYLSIAPRNDIYEREMHYISTIDPNSKRRIALHARRGDYWSWCNGDYYYPDALWLKIAAQKKIVQDASVWLFSDKYDSTLSQNFEKSGLIISRGTFEQDFLRFMLMDEIYGPPSTFSIMATHVARYKYGREIKFLMLPSISDSLLNASEININT